MPRSEYLNKHQKIVDAWQEVLSSNAAVDDHVSGNLASRMAAISFVHELAALHGHSLSAEAVNSAAGVQSLSSTCFLQVP